jgi:hypothetical protein
LLVLIGGLVNTIKSYTKVIWGDVMKLKTIGLVLLVLVLSSCGGKEFTAVSNEINECRTGYSDQATSKYNLPYMPIGTNVVASESTLSSG